MSTKLTLRLKEDLIESAKRYSRESGKSVSRVVADLFELIKNEKLGGEVQLPPMTRSLRGAIKDKPVSDKDYKEYLEKRYL